MCCCACLPRFCVASHVLCSVMYIGVGAVQLVAGIFFLISLPVFKVGSNVWTGVWNVVVGVGGAVFSSVGDLSPSKHRILLYLTITVLVLNLINLVVLELGEWRILMPDKVKATLQNHNLQTLVLYARMTTSISSALAVVIAFVDAQFMFCWLEHSLRPRHSPLDHKETVSDIEYIIPRAKSGSMGKNNMYNQYNQAAAQSWVFDSDTVGSTHSTHAPTHARANSEHLLPPHRESSPYGKLHHYTNSSKTVVLRRKSNPSSHKLIAHGNGDEDHRDPTKDQIMNGVLNKSKDVTAASNSSRLQPVVLVEGISNDERHLQFMTSFSRTPSPVHPRSESSSPCSNPAPIYECLERLTEPSVYRSRLNTALEATGSDERAERVSPCVSPRPHSVVIASDQQQYASLMVELERTIVAKFPAQDDSRRQSQSNVTQSTQHKQSNSDADFSRQLEAALQLIQDLESPNTVETPSDAPQLSFHQASEMASTSANNNNNNISQSHNDRAQRLLDNKSIEDRSSDDENTWSSSSHESPHKPLYGKVKGQLSRAAGQKSDLKRKHTTVIRIRDGTERTDESGVPRIDKRGVKDVETYRDPLENRLSSFQPREIGRSTSFSNNSGAGHENRAEKLNEIRFTSFSNNSEAGHENRVRIEEKRVKDDKNTYSSTNSQGFRPISSFQPRDLGRSTSFGTNSEATSKKRVSGVGKSLVKDGETREDSMENRLYSLQAEELGHSNSFSNNSRVIHENREPKIDGNHVKDLETQGDTKGNGLSSSQTKELGRSTSFSDNGRVINESRVPKFDGNHVQHEETFIDSLESRLSSSQLEVVAQSVNNNNLCNDSGVILDYNSEGSENSGKEVVVVVNNTNGAIGNGGVNGGLKECAVIREEVEEDGVAANGGLKNGNLINGAIQNGGVQNGGVQNGGVQNGGVQNGGIQNGGVQNGGVQNGGIQNGGVQNGALVSSSSSSASRSNSLKRSLSSVAKWRMFPKKRAARFVLTPELENTILKSESLLHLTDVELVARYDHNKSIQRKIEEKAWQKIIGASSTDSTC